jgi:hypothetical protein
LKKRDRIYHCPETNKQCAGGTCQHTCRPSEIERCRHAWAVRYTVNGVQRDKSFRDEIDAQKRMVQKQQNVRINQAVVQAQRAGRSG